MRRGRLNLIVGVEKKVLGERRTARCRQTMAAAALRNVDLGLGDAFDGGQCGCQVFAGDFGVVVSLHVDEEHVTQAQGAGQS
jgi:hypothetical protein